ncbi:hypothetical protein ACSVDA_19975 [Cytobacillus sp. Hm23]
MMNKKERHNGNISNRKFESIIHREKIDKDILTSVNKEKEINVVPIKDVLILNDNKTKRKMLLDVLKTDSLIQGDILQAAIKNDDTETSHYAASAILEVNSSLLNSLQKLELQLEITPTEVSIMKSYAQVIRQYVDLGILDERAELQYLYQYSQVLEKIIDIEPNNKENYIEKIECDLQLGELKVAEKYCELFMNYCSNEEEAYFITMKLYYILKDQEKFNEILNMLRNSPVRLTPLGLNKMRYWLKGSVG